MVSKGHQKGHCHVGGFLEQRHTQGITSFPSQSRHEFQKSQAFSAPFWTVDIEVKLNPPGKQPDGQTNKHTNKQKLQKEMAHWRSDHF